MGAPAATAGDDLEPNAHAFVIKVWREEPVGGGQRGSWRGYVTHVASGRRRYITRLSQVDRFIVGYLASLHVRLSLRWRLYLWLKR
jgi:hypothetical protein